MDLDQAIEFAVVSSWAELLKPGESGSIHVEYKNVTGFPLNSLEVWMIRNRGYGTLVCDCALSPADSPDAASRLFGMHFANSHSSTTLAGNLDFIMRNQSRFSRPAGRSIHGLVQIDRPDEAQRRDAEVWSSTVRAGHVAAVGSGT